MRKGREDGGDLLAGSAGFLPGEDFEKSPARGRSWRARGRFRGAGGSATGGFGELALQWQGRSPPTRPRPAIFIRGSGRLTNPQVLRYL